MAAGLFASVEDLVEWTTSTLETSGWPGPFKVSGSGAARMVEGDNVVCLVNGSLTGPSIAKVQQAAGAALVGAHDCLIVSLSELGGRVGDVATGVGAGVLVVATDGSVASRTGRWLQDDPHDEAPDDDPADDDPVESQDHENPDGDEDGWEVIETLDGTLLDEEQSRAWLVRLGLPAPSPLEPKHASDLYDLYLETSSRPCPGCGKSGTTVGHLDNWICECGTNRPDLSRCEECGETIHTADQVAVIGSPSDDLEEVDESFWCPTCASEYPQCDQCGSHVAERYLKPVVLDGVNRNLCNYGLDELFRATTWEEWDSQWSGCYVETEAGQRLREGRRRSRAVEVLAGAATPFPDEPPPPSELVAQEKERRIAEQIDAAVADPVVIGDADPDDRPGDRPGALFDDVYEVDGLDADDLDDWDDDDLDDWDDDDLDDDHGIG